MKKLFLLRHAQATGTAYDSPVTQYGLSEAKQVGEFIAQNMIMPELVLCSPAFRAITTYNRVFEAAYKKPRLAIEEGLYNASVKELLKIINTAPAEINNLMIIGHNPSITSLVTELKFLIDNEFYLDASDPIPTCKLSCLVFENAQWSNIENEYCVIEQVYWPNVNEMYKKKTAI